VREWRQRMGGMLFGLWPNAASALYCLRMRLPRFAGYLERAREIAGALRDVPGVRVVPDPPQTSLMHLMIDTTAERFEATARSLASERGVWTWQRAMTTVDPGVQRVELTVGDGTCALSAKDAAEIVATFAAG
jgi:threonine aldolase